MWQMPDRRNINECLYHIHVWYGMVQHYSNMVRVFIWENSVTNFVTHRRGTLQEIVQWKLLHVWIEDFYQWKIWSGSFLHSETYKTLPCLLAERCTASASTLDSKHYHFIHVLYSQSVTSYQTPQCSHRCSYVTLPRCHQRTHNDSDSNLCAVNETFSILSSLSICHHIQPHSYSVIGWYSNWENVTWNRNVVIESRTVEKYWIAWQNYRC